MNTVVWFAFVAGTVATVPPLYWMAGTLLNRFRCTVDRWLDEDLHTTSERDHRQSSP